MKETASSRVIMLHTVDKLSYRRNNKDQCTTCQNFNLAKFLQRIFVVSIWLLQLRMMSLAFMYLLK